MKGTVKEAHLSFGERALRGFGRGMVACVQRPKRYGPLPPLDEPTIFACRHVGLMDPVILMSQYPDMMIRPLAAQDYFDKNAFTKWFFSTAQCIPIDRINHSNQWLEDSVAALNRGESIIIFPEGKRNKEGDGLLPFHTGVTRLAVHSGARIVPVFNAVWHFPHRYCLSIGEPLRVPAIDPEKITAEWLREQTGKIRDAVAELAPRLNGD